MNTTERLEQLKQELSRHALGQPELIRFLLATTLAGGHALLEGVPGLGKTMVAKALGQALSQQFGRIQFTADLMPGDIIGTRMVMEDESGRRYFEFQPGPLFADLILADEINRASPKTQAALLEAMEERQVTVAREKLPLSPGFMVVATQNPIEMEGTFPLPEAQLDRFAVKLELSYPSAETLASIVDRHTTLESPTVKAVIEPADLDALRAETREVVVASHVRDYAVSIVMATHPDSADAPPAVRDYVRHGASPRGLLSLIMVAKALAIMDGRLNLAFDDIIAVAPHALRHRIMLNFEAEASGVTQNDIVAAVLATCERPTGAGPA